MTDSPSRMPMPIKIAIIAEILIGIVLLGLVITFFTFVPTSDDSNGQNAYVENHTGEEKDESPRSKNGLWTPEQMACC